MIAADRPPMRETCEPCRSGECGLCPIWWCDHYPHVTSEEKR